MAAPPADRGSKSEGVAELGRLRDNVVKIFVRSAAPTWTSPWQRRPQAASTGSGLCICGKARHVLTNAHVVRDAVAVRVRRYGDSIRYPARILCSSPQCDLALLEVADDAFWSGLGVIELTEEVPPLDSDVLTVGYPMGGDNISVTRGVVSRIDLMDYTFSPTGGERNLVIQVDAAINPGNSGGPVLGTHGRAIGVAFAGMTSGEGIGYVIPSTVVHFFLRGFKERGAFAGLCSLGLRVQQTQSAALRSLHCLEQAGCSGGVLVVDVAPLSSAAAAGVEAGDILLAIDKVPVAEDASVPFRGTASSERIGFDSLVTRKAVGEHMELLVLKAGRREVAALDLRAAPLPKLVPRMPGVDAAPSYLVFGGLVFTTLTLPWLVERFRGLRKAPADLQEKLSEHKTRPDQEVVVLAKVLAADVNHGYEDFQCYQLVEFAACSGEGVEATALEAVQSLAHLRQLLKASVGQEAAENRSAFLRFRFSNDLEVVLEASACLASQAEILRQHGIPFECSADMEATTESEVRSRL